MISQNRDFIVKRRLILMSFLFAEIGEIKEVGAGYTFFWSGRKTEERIEAGVGFAIK